MGVQLATIDELTAWAGPVDATLAGLILDGVSAAALRIAAAVSTSWSGPDTVPAEIKTLVLQVAARVATNPAGFQSETLAGYSYTVDTRQPGGVTFTDSERQALLEAAGIELRPSARALSVPYA